MNDEPQHKHRKYWLLCIFAVFIAILGVILPEIDTKPITYLNASNISTFGATANGTLQNISDINNGYYNVSELNAQPFYVIVNFTNITNFSFVEAKAKYFSVSGTPSTHVVDVEILCHTDMEYEDVFFLENAAEWRYFTRHFPDSSHFISNGNVSIKFNHSSNGNVNHRLWIDTVRLIILPQYAQNTVTLNQYFNTTGTGSQNLSQVLTNGNDANRQNITNVQDINMTSGYLNNSNGNVSTSSLIVAPSGIPRFWDTNTVAEFERNVVAFRTVSSSGTFFGANRVGNNISSPTSVPANTIIFSFFGAGYDGNTFSGGRAKIEIWSGTNAWTNTSNPTIIKFQTTDLNSTIATDRLIVNQNGNITMSKYAGAGRAYACFEADGTISRGTPGC